MFSSVLSSLKGYLDNNEQYTFAPPIVCIHACDILSLNYCLSFCSVLLLCADLVQMCAVVSVFSNTCFRFTVVFVLMLKHAGYYDLITSTLIPYLHIDYAPFLQVECVEFSQDNLCVWTDVNLEC